MVKVEAEIEVVCGKCHTPMYENCEWVWDPETKSYILSLVCNNCGRTVYLRKRV